MNQELNDYLRKQARRTIIIEAMFAASPQGQWEKQVADFLNTQLQPKELPPTGAMTIFLATDRTGVPMVESFRVTGEPPPKSLEESVIDILFNCVLPAPPMEILRGIPPRAGMWLTVRVDRD